MFYNIWNFLLNNSQEIQTLMAIMSAAAIVVTGYLAWRIGKKQNEINTQALEIQDFVELFIMPQEIYEVKEKLSVGNVVKPTGRWNLLIKNAGNYPVYLIEYKLNEITKALGKTVVPVGLDNWYYASIPQETQNKKELILEIKFEDYLGRKYYSKTIGKFENSNWNIQTEKKVEINE